jgi:tetratricopeptide (TPR) repeat protein
VADFLQNLFVQTETEENVAPEQNARRVLANARRVFGDDHATVAATLSSRAMQLQSAGELERAELLYNEALRVWREEMGVENRGVSTTLAQLGMLQFKKGDHLAAEEALREALAISERSGGGYGVGDTEALAVLASLAANKADYAEAKRLLRLAIQTYERTGDPTDLEYAIIVNQLANLMVMSGDEEGARDAVPATLDAWRDALPDGNPFLAQILIQIGMWHLDQEEYRAAHDLMREALTIFRDAEEFPDRYAVLAVRFLFASADEMFGGEEDFAAGMLEVIHFAEDSLRDPALLVDPLVDVGGEMRARGEHEAALIVARKAIARSEMQSDQALRDEALRLLGNVAWDIVKVDGRPIDDYQRAHRAIRDVWALSPDSPAFSNTLGAAQYRLGEYERALATLAHSDAWYVIDAESRQPSDLAFLTMTYAQLDEEKRALATMRQLQELMQRPDLATRQENQALLREAEVLLRDKARGR